MKSSKVKSTGRWRERESKKKKNLFLWSSKRFSTSKKAKKRNRRDKNKFRGDTATPPLTPPSTSSLGKPVISLIAQNSKSSSKKRKKKNRLSLHLIKKREKSIFSLSKGKEISQSRGKRCNRYYDIRKKKKRKKKTSDLRLIDWVWLEMGAFGYAVGASPPP